MDIDGKIAAMKAVEFIAFIFVGLTISMAVLILLTAIEYKPIIQHINNGMCFILGCINAAVALIPGFILSALICKTIFKDRTMSKITKKCIGHTSDGKRKMWELACQECGKKWEHSFNIPFEFCQCECGATEFIQYLD